MNTDFFTRIAQLGLAGRLVVTIKMAQPDQWAVAVHYTDPKVNESSLNQIPPLCFTASPETLNAEFFSCLRQPLQQTHRLLTNLTEYEKSLEKARASSHMATASKSASSTAANGPKADPKLKAKYDTLMKKVEQLAKKEYFGQAISQLPNATEFRSFAKEIEAKKEELYKQMQAKRGGSLFDNYPFAEEAMSDQLEAQAPSAENSLPENESSNTEDDDAFDDEDNEDEPTFENF